MKGDPAERKGQGFPVANHPRNGQWLPQGRKRLKNDKWTGNHKEPYGPCLEGMWNLSASNRGSLLESWLCLIMCVSREKGRCGAQSGWGRPVKGFCSGPGARWCCPGRDGGENEEGEWSGPVRLAGRR